MERKLIASVKRHVRRGIILPKDKNSLEI